MSALTFGQILIIVWFVSIVLLLAALLACLGDGIWLRLAERRQTREWESWWTAP